MSGRGGRSGGGSQTVRAVASALGIARHEMGSFQQKQILEPPPLYPVVKRNVLPLEGNAEELTFMSDLKQEITEAFQNSEFYLDKETKKGIQRYVDKYDNTEKSKYRPDFSRIPDELCWIKDRSAELANKPKRKKLDPLAKRQLLDEKFRKLEENETVGDPEREQRQAESGDDDKSETSEKSEHADAEAVSEDEGEEDNDYISNYFDNGEGYGDAGSDENMDADEY